MRHDPEVARVRLNSGGLSAAQVRMGSRGASERLRPPGDDINSPAEGAAALVCGWCGSRKRVDDARPRRCGACRADEQVVREVAAALRAAGQPPLGRKAPAGAPLSARRSQGEAARSRLRSRKRTMSQMRATAPPAAKPAGTRRITAGQKAAGARRLRQRVTELERELARLDRTDGRRGQLREELAAAQRLLSDWKDGVH
jgi:hypothetical protein